MYTMSIIFDEISAVMIKFSLEFSFTFNFKRFIFLYILFFLSYSGRSFFKRNCNFAMHKLKTKIETITVG